MQSGYAEKFRAHTVPRIFKSLYEYIVLYGGLFCFGLMCLAWNLPAILLYWVLPRRLGEPLGQHVIMLGFRGYLAALRASGLVRYDLSALDTLRAERSLIIAPNHPSSIDIVLIASRLPRTACILKGHLWDNPLLGAGARLAGYIPNDITWHLVRKAADAVQAGHQLLIFPEGTRTVAPPVNKFKGGFGVVAQKSGCPVQTVFIETDSPFLGKDWPLLKKPVFPLEYRVRLGRRFETIEDAKGFVGELEHYYREELAASGTEEARSARHD